jgi:hypothetical protein
MAARPRLQSRSIHFVAASQRLTQSCVREDDQRPKEREYRKAADGKSETKLWRKSLTTMELPERLENPAAKRTRSEAEGGAAVHDSKYACTSVRRASPTPRVTQLTRSPDWHMCYPQS